jgi:hypothetical protein
VIPTAEPFIVQRFELPFGSLEFMLHVPVVLYSPKVTRRVFDQDNATWTMQSTRLVETASPRIYLGFQAELDRLWR